MRRASIVATLIAAGIAGCGGGAARHEAQQLSKDPQVQQERKQATTLVNACLKSSVNGNVVLLAKPGARQKFYACAENDVNLNGLKACAGKAIGRDALHRHRRERMTNDAIGCVQKNLKSKGKTK